MLMVEDESLTEADDLALGADTGQSEDEQGARAGASQRAAGAGRGRAAQPKAKRAPLGQGKGRRKAFAEDTVKKKGLKTSGAGVKFKDHDPKLHRRCRACQLYFLKSQMPDKGFCYEDARAYDGLARLAIKQSEEEWWEETKSDDKILVPAMKAYKAACPDSMHGKARGGGSFKVAEYKETITAESNVDMQYQGKMMWWGEYEEFSRTAAGGRLSSAQAMSTGIDATTTCCYLVFPIVS